MSDPTNQPLDYESPSPQPVHAAFVVLVGVGTALVVLASVLVGFGVGELAFVLWGVELVAIIGLAIYFQRDPRRRRLALGIWIGLGVALLLEGICFGLLAR